MEFLTLFVPKNIHFDQTNRTLNKIKDLATIEMGGQKYCVELNGGTKKENFDIHIQNT